MGVNLFQKADGSAVLKDELSGLEVFRVGGPASASTTVPQWRASFFLKVPLTAADTAGGIVSIANPFGVQVMVTRIILNVTTQSSGACTADFGIAANGTTLNDSLIDGLSLASAAQIADNLGNAGTNGKSRQLWGVTQFVTGSVASGASAGLVGFAYVECAML